MNHETLSDRIVAQIARRVAGCGTRRSFLERAARVLLGVLGIELLPALPVDARPHGRDAPGPAKDPNCTDPQYCGIHGKLCGNCGGSDTGCPAGCSQGPSYWWACCSHRLYLYYDCCTSGSAPDCGAICQGPNPCGTSPWCGGTTYCCTLALAVEYCP
jgi:hypothetical protein